MNYLKNLTRTTDETEGLCNFFHDAPSIVPTIGSTRGLRFMVHSIGTKTVFTIFCILLVFVSGCGTGGKDSGQRAEPKPTFQTKDIDERLREANSRLAFRLYEEVLKEENEGNVFISPFSVSTALAMTYNGAAGETKEAMADALQFQELTLEEINHAYAALQTVIAQADPDVELSIANSLWGRAGQPFKPDFLEQNAQFYDARITELDFDDPQASRTINDWVREQTNGKIEEIIDKNIDPETILFLINAIYFKGEWAEPFDAENTADEDFHLLDGTTKSVPMMSRSGEYPYYKNEAFEAIQLPYGNERLSMTVFLPDANSSLEQFLQQWDVQKWSEWMAHFDKQTGSIHLPRFQLEFETTLDDALKAMGMEIAFNKKRANFERMVTIPPNAYINEVKHQSFIEVNEEGTEATAATSVEMAIESAPLDTFQMKVDRAFFFTIHDQETNTLLFMGSVVEP